MNCFIQYWSEYSLSSRIVMYVPQFYSISNKYTKIPLKCGHFRKNDYANGLWCSKFEEHTSEFNKTPFMWGTHLAWVQTRRLIQSACVYLLTKMYSIEVLTDHLPSETGKMMSFPIRVHVWSNSLSHAQPWVEPQH